MDKHTLEIIQSNPNIINWNSDSLSKFGNIFIRKFKDKVNWNFISCSQKLSEGFIREFKNYVNWVDISRNQKLSEDFIREFKDEVYWDCISAYQNLSEGFIREFKNYVDWYEISHYKKLSEDFIREFKDYVDWYEISYYQKLSESFIREFKDKVSWGDISRYQKLTQKFIIEFQDCLDLNYLVSNHIISKTTAKKIRDENYIFNNSNWYYVTKEYKEDYIRKNTDYEIKNGMVIAYKSTMINGASVYAPDIKYRVGKEYTAKADCNINNKNSFGLSAWTKEGALEYYYGGLLFKVGIKIEDIAAIIPTHNNKIRATKIKILSKVKG